MLFVKIHLKLMFYMLICYAPVAFMFLGAYLISTATDVTNIIYGIATSLFGVVYAFVVTPHTRNYIRKRK